MKPLYAALIAASLTAPQPVLADGHQDGLTGATVVITNTFQGGQTEGVETDVAAFGLLNNQFAAVGDGVEFPEFITLYTVDISGDSIAFTWGDGAFAQQLSARPLMETTTATPLSSTCLQTWQSPPSSLMKPRPHCWRPVRLRQ